MQMCGIFSHVSAPAFEHSSCAHFHRISTCLPLSVKTLQLSVTAAIESFHPSDTLGCKCARRVKIYPWQLLPK